jgi:hypothetical protein
LELRYAFDALALERFVTDRKDFVDEQDVGVDIDSHREAEPHVHARGVVADLHVDELFELGEGHDLVEDALGLLLRQAEDRRVHEHVLTPGELVVEPGAEFEQRRNPAARHDLAGRRLQDPRDALQERGLARPVVAEKAHGRALLDVEVDVAQGPELFERNASEVNDPFLQRGIVLVIQAEVLGDTANLDGRGQLTAPRRS